MTIRRYLALTSVCALLSACSKGAPAAKSDSAAMAGSSASSMAAMNMGPAPVIPKGADYSADDVSFMQGMIYHHGQALVMTAEAVSHGASPSVALLCKKMTLTQEDEIHLMQTWLRTRNLHVTDPKDAHQMMMPGMLSAAQLSELDKARGAQWDSLFLVDMIQHHQGAIKMVQDLFASPYGGQASEISAYANDVSSGQLAEIGVMQELLNTSHGAGRP